MNIAREQTAKQLASRVVQTPRSAAFVDSAIIVAVNAVEAPERVVPLVLISQQFEESLDLFRQMLCHHLDRTLVHSDNIWVPQVALEDHPSTGMPQVVVHIGPTQDFPPEQNVEYVLDAAMLYMAPFAERVANKSCRLRAGERLVPLHCVFQQPTTLTIALPEGLHFFGHPAAAELLEHLRARLDNVLWDFNLQWVTVTEQHIQIKFGERDYPKVADLHRAEQVVARELSDCTTLPNSTFTKLLFVPADLHEADERGYPAP